jgi:hypothetical protein
LHSIEGEERAESILLECPLGLSRLELAGLEVNVDLFPGAERWARMVVQQLQGARGSGVDSSAPLTMQNADNGGYLRGGNVDQLRERWAALRTLRLHDCMASQGVWERE